MAAEYGESLMFSGLPEDVLFAITERMVVQDVLQCRMVNRDWRQAVDGSPLFWERVIFQLPDKGGSLMELLTDKVAERVRHFRSSKLTDSLLSVVIGKCKNLSRLDLSSSWQITDARFPQLAEDANLRMLRLRGCRQVSDIGVAHLQSMNDLEELSLAHCPKISPKSAAVFEFFPRLRVLDLSYCDISDESLFHLEKAKCLKSLSLKGVSGISETGVNALATNMVNLVELDISKFKEGGKVLENIKGLVSLEVLNVSSCEVMDDHMIYLAGLTKLRVLKMAECKSVSDEGFSNLAKLTNLTDLCLRSCHLATTKSVEYISRCNSMKVLDIMSCRRIGSIQELHSWKSLEELNLSGCRMAATSNMLTPLFLKNTGLRDLRLNECVKLDGSCFVAFKSRAAAENLRVIDIGKCRRIDINQLEFLEYCVNLQELDISEVGGVNASTICVLRHFRDLRKFAANSCHSFGDEAMKVLSQLQLQRLTSLQLNDTGICDEGIASISKLTNLQELHIVCDGITDAGLCLIQSMPMLGRNKVYI